MVISYRLTAAVIGIMIAAAILFLVRRDHLQVRYAYWWLLIALGVLLLGFFPEVIDAVAPVLGISYPPVLAIVLGAGVIIIKMLMMDLEHTRQQRDIRWLVQRLAIYEAEVARRGQAIEDVTETKISQE